MKGSDFGRYSRKRQRQMHGVRDNDIQRWAHIIRGRLYGQYEAPRLSEPEGLR